MEIIDLDIDSNNLNLENDNKLNKIDNEFKIKDLDIDVLDDSNEEIKEIKITDLGNSNSDIKEIKINDLLDSNSDIKEIKINDLVDSNRDIKKIKIADLGESNEDIKEIKINDLGDSNSDIKENEIDELDFNIPDNSSMLDNTKLQDTNKENNEIKVIKINTDNTDLNNVNSDLNSTENMNSNQIDIQLLGNNNNSNQTPLNIIKLDSSSQEQKCKKLNNFKIKELDEDNNDIEFNLDNILSNDNELNELDDSLINNDSNNLDELLVPIDNTQNVNLENLIPIKIFMIGGNKKISLPTDFDKLENGSYKQTELYNENLHSAEYITYKENLHKFYDEQYKKKFIVKFSYRVGELGELIKECIDTKCIETIHPPKYLYLDKVFNYVNSNLENIIDKIRELKDKLLNISSKNKLWSSLHDEFILLREQFTTLNHQKEIFETYFDKVNSNNTNNEKIKSLNEEILTIRIKKREQFNNIYIKINDKSPDLRQIITEYLDDQEIKRINEEINTLSDREIIDYVITELPRIERNNIMPRIGEIPEVKKLPIKLREISKVGKKLTKTVIRDEKQKHIVTFNTKDSIYNFINSYPNRFRDKELFLETFRDVDDETFPINSICILYSTKKLTIQPYINIKKTESVLENIRKNKYRDGEKFWVKEFGNICKALGISKDTSRIPNQQISQNVNCDNEPIIEPNDIESTLEFLNHKIVLADNINNKGKFNKKTKKGKCIIPFRIGRGKGKEQNTCVDGKTGKWCATEVDDNNKMKQWGYCLTKTGDESPLAEDPEIDGEDEGDGGAADIMPEDDSKVTNSKDEDNTSAAKGGNLDTDIEIVDLGGDNDNMESINLDNLEETKDTKENETIDTFEIESLDLDDDIETLENDLEYDGIEEVPEMIDLGKTNYIDDDESYDKDIKYTL